MSQLIKTNIKNFNIRFAEENNASIILDFIKALAKYEKRLSEVVATEADIKESLFNKKIAEAIIGEYCGEPVCFAIFFHNFSTFSGKPGIYIEDIFVNPEMRGKGFGTIILEFIASLAVERNCGRIEWSVLRWNEPSIKFYEKIGATDKDEWVLYKLSGKNLTNLASSFEKD
ncbi:MAG: GNAT family N-acetyltransferase [Actinobacteria bacterium]|nr:GNAT family N-acetyltransferase [Actinomycetota bacterium]